MTLLLACMIAAGALNPSPPAQAPRKLVYAAGYIPNVQFAPFYIALSRGYYAEAGLDVEIDYTIGPDVFKLAALNKVQIASADPDAFLLAAAKGMPLVHVASLYQRYPIALISRDDILRSKDLPGKRIGISGTYGSSYLGLKAILGSMDLGVDDVRLASIGFTQVTALQQGRVDAVVGYINNERVRLEQLGILTHARMLAGVEQMPGVGLMVNRTFWRDHRKDAVAFLEATFRGMADVLANPTTCYAEIVEKFLPQLKDETRFRNEYIVLERTLPFWRSERTDQDGFGQVHPSQWQNLVKLLGREPASPPLDGWQKHVDREFTWQPTPQD